MRTTMIAFRNKMFSFGIENTQTEDEKKRNVLVKKR